MPLAGLAGLSQLAWLAPARWGFAAGATTVNLNVLLPAAGMNTDPLWRHVPANWLRDVGLTLGLAVIFLLLAWIRLHMLGPRRRHLMPGRKPPALTPDSRTSQRGTAPAGSLPTASPAGSLPTSG